MFSNAFRHMHLPLLLATRGFRFCSLQQSAFENPATEEKIGVKIEDNEKGASHAIAL
jgi:hypothetical protein